MGIEPSQVRQCGKEAVCVRTWADIQFGISHTCQLPTIMPLNHHTLILVILNIVIISLIIGIKVSVREWSKYMEVEAQKQHQESVRAML